MRVGPRAGRPAPTSRGTAGRLPGLLASGPRGPGMPARREPDPRSGDRPRYWSPLPAVDRVVVGAAGASVPDPAECGTVVAGVRYRGPGPGGTSDMGPLSSRASPIPTALTLLAPRTPPARDHLGRRVALTGGRMAFQDLDRSPTRDGARSVRDQRSASKTSCWRNRRRFYRAVPVHRGIGGWPPRRASRRAPHERSRPLVSSGVAIGEAHPVTGVPVVLIHLPARRIVQVDEEADIAVQETAEPASALPAAAAHTLDPRPPPVRRDDPGQRRFLARADEPALTVNHEPPAVAGQAPRFHGGLTQIDGAPGLERIDMDRREAGRFFHGLHGTERAGDRAIAGSGGNAGGRRGLGITDDEQR